MKKFTSLLTIITILVLPVMLQAQPPSNIVATPVAASVPRLDKFELNVTLTAGYINPYDYADISIRMALVAPSGRKDTVDAFFIQDYTLNTTNGSLAVNGTGGFKIRYSPDETGTWQYVIIVKNTAGTATTPAQSFQVTTSSAKGFVRKNSTNYLNFDNNDQYFPIGENLAWQQNNIYLNYKSWLQKLSDNKANFIRVWQAVWGLGIEWKSGSDGYFGVGRYKQTSAYYTDWLLDECKAKGIYMMLCINHHGMVSSVTDANWNESPYNAANGGPCANTWDFFTNPVAKNLHKSRLRYIVARWGYSPQIMSWELFNEVNWTDQYAAHKDEVKDWHIEMANYLKSIDVYKHLVTTSYGDNAFDPNVWSNPVIDFTQVHNYINSPNVENALAGVVADYITQYNKPALNGEFGINPASSSLSTIDPNGIHIHNSIWATAFSGAMGAGMTWWWDNYIDPQNLYTHFKPLSEFIATLTLKADNYKKTASVSSGGGTSDLTLTPGVGFAIAGATNFTIDATGAITPSASQLSGYLFGSTFNTQHRAPPVFNVSYPVAGQFKVITGGSASTSSPKVDIYLDGTLLVDQAATVNTTYTINVPAGAHVIKVDNLGTDWISISNYVFTNIGSALNSYTLKSADNKKMAGWIHNKRYNWQYVKDNGIPASVTGATLSVSGMENGDYMVQFINCSTGATAGTVNATATSGNLLIAVPTVSWDLGVTAVWGGVTPVVDLVTAKGLMIYPNPVVQGRLYLSYELQTPSQVAIDLFDITGNKVAVIFNGKQMAGTRLVEWSDRSGKIAPGVYFLRFMIGKEMTSRKITIYK